MKPDCSWEKSNHELSMQQHANLEKLKRDPNYKWKICLKGFCFILKEVMPNMNRKFVTVNVIIANVKEHVLLDKRCIQIHNIECGHKLHLHFWNIIYSVSERTKISSITYLNGWATVVLYTFPTIQLINRLSINIIWQIIYSTITIIYGSTI